MPIKFTCSCGKRLRARDEMAGRRTFCPRCGLPVGVPSGQASQRGTEAAPLTPIERQRLQFRSRLPVATRPAAEPATHAQPEPGDWAPPSHEPSKDERLPPPRAAEELASPPPKPLDINLVRMVFAPRQQRRQHHARIERWHHCLTYPIRTGVIIAMLSTALTILIAGVVLLLPKLFELEAEAFWVTLLLLPCLTIPFTVFGYTFGFLEAVLASAAAGEAEPLRKATRNLAVAARSFAYWMICFLAGPIIPAGLAVFFWVNSGDLVWLDWAILAELGVVAGAYWFFVMLAVSRSGRLRDINPLVVFELIDRLGFPAIVLVLITSASLIGHVLLALLSVQTFHADKAEGIGLLLACLTSGLFLATFFFRLLGVWCYRLHVKIAGVDVGPE